MMMSAEETEWIWCEYHDSPFYAAVDRFAKDVSGIDGMPAGHPSLLFYIAVYAIDDIKCIDCKKRRLERCRNLRNDIVHYLKINGHDNHKELAAEAIYCVRFGLEALTITRCLKEFCIMSEHINELVPNPKVNAEIREIARKCFWDDEFKEWFKGYYNDRCCISEAITLKVKEMRKANPPKENLSIHRGRGNRNWELFSDVTQKEQKIKELQVLFEKENLSMVNISSREGKRFDLIVIFYKNMENNKLIDSDKNPKGYLRFLKEAGFTFDTSDSNVEKKLRKTL